VRGARILASGHSCDNAHSHSCSTAARAILPAFSTDQLEVWTLSKNNALVMENRLKQKRQKEQNPQTFGPFAPYCLLYLNLFARLQESLDKSILTADDQHYFPINTNEQTQRQH
jgi:hypothetical protein